MRDSVRTGIGPLGLPYTVLPPSSVNSLPRAVRYDIIKLKWGPDAIDEVATATTLMLKVLDQIYTVSPLKSAS